jgi:hypothetical protein
VCGAAIHAQVFQTSRRGALSSAHRLSQRGAMARGQTIAEAALASARPRLQRILARCPAFRNRIALRIGSHGSLVPRVGIVELETADMRLPGRPGDQEDRSAEAGGRVLYLKAWSVDCRTGLGGHLDRIVVSDRERLRGLSQSLSQFGFWPANGVRKCSILQTWRDVRVV